MAKPIVNAGGARNSTHTDERDTAELSRAQLEIYPPHAPLQTQPPKKVALNLIIESLELMRRPQRSASYAAKNGTALQRGTRRGCRRRVQRGCWRDAREW